MRNLKGFIALFIVLVFSITVAGCGSKTVATVNGEKITQADLDKRMAKVKMSLEQQGASFSGSQGQQMLKALEKQTLDEMITQALIEQAAKKEGVYPSTADIKKSVDDIIASFGGQEKYNEALKTYNYTSKEIEELKAFDLARTNLYNKVTADVKVTDNDIKQWYDTHKDQYKDPAKIKARDIMIKFDNPNQAPAANGQAPAKVGRSEQDAQKMAEDIIQQLNNGADFAKLAQEKSEDDKTKSDGGLIKDMSGNDSYAQYSVMPKGFDDAAAALKPGQYSKTPVKTTDGFYIVKLESFTSAKQLTFDEAKAKIQQELPATRKQDKFVNYITELQNKAKIVNNLPKDTPQTPSSSDQQQLPPGHPSTSTTPQN